jgi:hypothetical protein
MARRQAKGGGVLDRHGGRRKGKQGAGSVGRLACWAGSEEMGQMANGLVKRKELTFEIQNWFLGLGKLITENPIAEIIGKISQKIVGKLGMQECKLEWIL